MADSSHEEVFEDRPIKKEINMHTTVYLMIGFYLIVSKENRYICEMCLLSGYLNEMIC